MSFVIVSLASVDCRCLPWVWNVQHCHCQRRKLRRIQVGICLAFDTENQRLLLDSANMNGSTQAARILPEFSFDTCGRRQTQRLPRRPWRARQELQAHLPPPTYATACLWSWIRAVESSPWCMTAVETRRLRCRPSADPTDRRAQQCIACIVSTAPDGWWCTSEESAIPWHSRNAD